VTIVRNNHADDDKREIKEKVNQKILNFISYKLRSEREISERLNRYLEKYKKINKSQKEEIKVELLEKLREVNIINDHYFAKSFVMQKIKSPKPASRMQTRQFLMKKGVPRSIISQALKIYTDDQEDQKITKAAKKKLSSLKNFNKLQKKKKLYNYLAGKGYPFARIRSIVDRIIEVA